MLSLKRIFICFFALLICFANIIPIAASGESVALNDMNELLDEIALATSSLSDELTVVTDFAVKQTDITMPDIARRAGKLDAFTSGLLRSMQYKVHNKGSTYEIHFSFSYYITEQEYAKLVDFANEFVNQMTDMDDYDKVKYTHDYLIENCTYNIDRDGPYNCIFNGQSNCNGYALAFSLIMRECGIDCRYITGTDHAWNAVKLGAFWYNIDVTWDDTGNGISYDYFLCGRHEWKKHRTTEATAGFRYNQSPVVNWAGYILYWGWPALILLVVILIKLTKIGAHV